MQSIPRSDTNSNGVDVANGGLNLVELAQRLKQRRTERGLTLEDVASKAGLTRGWLSKVENFRLTPSLPALCSIASVLDLSLSELFEGLDARPAIALVPKSDRVVLRRDEDVSKLTYASLAHRRPMRAMDPFIITVPHSDNRPRMSHTGEEFMIVIRGSVALEYGDESHPLNEGDSAYFDGDTPHRLVCLSDEPAQVLSVFYRGADAGELGDASPDDEA